MKCRTCEDAKADARKPGYDPIGNPHPYATRDAVLAAHRRGEHKEVGR